MESLIFLNNVVCRLGVQNKADSKSCQFLLGHGNKANYTGDTEQTGSLVCSSRGRRVLDPFTSVPHISSLLSTCSATHRSSVLQKTKCFRPGNNSTIAASIASRSSPVESWIANRWLKCKLLALNGSFGESVTAKGTSRVSSTNKIHHTKP